MKRAETLSSSRGFTHGQNPKETDMLKKLMITTAVSGLMMGGALAQSKPIDEPAAKPMTPPAATAPAATPSPKTTMSPSTTGSLQVVNTQKSDQWLASKFKGTDVVGADNEKIGDVSDLLFDKTGKIEAFIISVGGFLGMGAKDVALAPASFEVVAGDKSKNESDKLKLSMTKDQLKQAANFEPYNPPRTTTGMGGTPRPAPAPAPAVPAPRNQ
jgi:sporulation protein YlmC with PRC-barrel domain